LHGFPETGRLAWKHQLPFFIKAGYRVIAPDLRGFNTSVKGDEKVCNPFQASEDVAKLIEIYGYKKAIVIAHDFGGAVAWFLTYRHPEKVEKLINFLPDIRALRETAGIKALIMGWYRYFFLLRGISEWKVERFDYSWGLYFGLMSSNKGAFTLNDVKQLKQALSQEGSLTSTLNYYRFNLQTDVEEKYTLPTTATETQTLLIVGKKDPYIDMEGAIQAPKDKFNKNIEIIVD